MGVLWSWDNQDQLALLASLVSMQIGPMIIIGQMCVLTSEPSDVRSEWAPAAAAAAAAAAAGVTKSGLRCPCRPED